MGLEWVSSGSRVGLELQQDAEFGSHSHVHAHNAASQPMHGYTIGTVFGFVEELIVEDDPEYHWRDQFRASRITNHQRQMVLYQLSGKLRRKMGLKVQEMGGNAVLAYSQHFDLEGEGGGGIVARGQGTAVILSKRRSKSRTDTAAAAAAAAAAVAAAASAGSTTIEQSASVPTESGLITRVSSSVVVHSIRRPLLSRTHVPRAMALGSKSTSGVQCVWQCSAISLHCSSVSVATRFNW